MRDSQSHFGNISRVIEALKKTLQGWACSQAIHSKAWRQTTASWYSRADEFCPVTGTPQGRVIFAVLANSYFFYALDLWFEENIKPGCRGNVHLIRFADDYVYFFQYRDELKMVERELPQRLDKISLELAPVKTKNIKSSKFETTRSESFVLLGFEYRWILSWKKLW
ncbi:reverse transcriptase domain-containing protein [Desulfogranum japonicum]|uniref:reverse transcriptase domain-containing protein n=1 Tax=Desulfogranum japonicum TaxID=231447 RepID=UPI0013779DF3|nr:reverse transcriptase domain-containing protein [Desulfogranum japonicum]